MKGRMPKTVFGRSQTVRACRQGDGRVELLWGLELADELEVGLEEG